MQSPPDPTLQDLLRSVQNLEETGRSGEALARAWRALDLAPEHRAAKQRVARLLFRFPSEARLERSADIARLIRDPDLDPLYLAGAGWGLLTGVDGYVTALADDPEALAGRLEVDPLALGLLEETYVNRIAAERALVNVRRWLLLSGRWPEHPRLVAALGAQASNNGGAWPFGLDERTRLESGADRAIRAAYLPRRPKPAGDGAFADPVTRAVVEQYESWPYPVWSRVTAPKPTTVPAMVAEQDGGRPSNLPVAAEILVAGCGTGREAVLTALRYPDARITAIDISTASLTYAEERCCEAGLTGIVFQALDLHRVAELGKSFDLIVCSGVLHHLPDPQAGWEALAHVLEPGGAMRVMVYSRVGRLPVLAARRHVAHLLDRQIDDDLLREARARLIEKTPNLLSEWRDFYTLGGIHDLIFHRHEDPFDVPRIVRALDRLGLELLAFELPSAFDRARYREEHPDDPLFRDVAAWASLERNNPYIFRSMYAFWCRRPAL